MAPRRDELAGALAGVSHSTDFPPALAELTKLDACLRCPICGDLFNNVVMLAKLDCCHAFCSSCLRSALSISSTKSARTAGAGGVGGSHKCPLCATPADEGHIRRVPALDEAVVAWGQARQSILDLVKRADAALDRPSTAKRHKRKASRPVDDATSDADFDPKASQSLSVDDDAPRSKSRRITRSHSTAAARPSKPAQAELDSDIEILDGDPTDPETLVTCFLCQKRIKARDQDGHVQRCLLDSQSVGGASSTGAQAWGFLSQKPGSSKPGLNSTAKGSTLRSSRSRPSDPVPPSDTRLASVTYTSLTLTALRSLLSQHSLAVPKGREKDATFLADTHRYWVMLWNSNLDAAKERRKSKEELRRDLDAWFKAQSKEMTSAAAAAAAVAPGEERKILADEEAVRRHDRKYAQEWKDLVAQARRTAPKKAAAKAAEATVKDDRTEDHDAVAEAQDADPGEPAPVAVPGPSTGPPAADVSIVVQGSDAEEPFAPGLDAADESAPEASTSFSLAFSPSLLPPSPTPSSPSALLPDIPLDPPSPDPDPTSTGSAGPQYDAEREPPPSQNGIRSEGMGFSRLQGQRGDRPETIEEEDEADEEDEEGEQERIEEED